MATTPNQANMSNTGTFRNWVVENQQGAVYRGPKTTLSQTGGRQYNVTATSLSDIMQGTMSVRGPEELNLVVNKALSNDLDLLYESDYTGVSAFSTAKYEFGNTPTGTTGTGTDDSTNPHSSTWEGDEDTALEGKYVAQIGFQSGIKEDSKPELWRMVGISYRESRWRPKATNHSSSDRGLWQTNMFAWGNTLSEAGLITGGPFDDPHDGYEIWEPQLHDPVTNGAAVYHIIYGRGGDPVGNYTWAWQAGPEGWTRGGDPMYNVDQAKAKAAVAQAKAEGLLGKPFMPPASSTGGGATGSTANGNHTIAQVKAASKKVGTHPNNWLVKQGPFVSGAKLTFSESGVSPGYVNETRPPGKPIDYPVYKENGKAWMFPSLLNHLWFIFENGFILSDYLGAIGCKLAGSGSGRPSNHCYGGAIDIGKIGYASEGQVYSISRNVTKSREIMDKLMNLLASTPESGWADEYGNDFGEVHYGTGDFHTSLDPGHLHIGFSPDRSGTLINALGGSNSSGASSYSAVPA